MSDMSGKYYEACRVIKRLKQELIEVCKNNRNQPVEQVSKRKCGNHGEYILCAAVWVQDGLEHVHQPKNVSTGFVVLGRRHANCLYTISLMKDYRLTAKTQGFITSTNRYVDRMDARDIAIKTGMYFPEDDRPINKKMLFSEDIY